MNIFGILSMIGGLALFLYGRMQWVQDFQSYPAAVWNVFLRN